VLLRLKTQIAIEDKSPSTDSNGLVFCH